MFRNFRHLVRNLSKTADMGLNPGEVDYGSRQGLRWKRFLPGQFTGSGSLPEEASSTIENMMGRFKEQFGQYRMNPDTEKILSKYRGMIFVIYAHDTAVGDQSSESIPPELQDTASFVRDNHLRMIPNGTDKSIGTPFWISYNGHAYVDLFPDKIRKGEKYSAESIFPLKSVKQKNKLDAEGVPSGNLTIGPTTNGYGLFLEHEDGSIEPALRNQSPGNTAKFFKDNIAMGRTVVYIPDIASNDLRSARRINLGKGIKEDPAMQSEQQRRIDIFNEAKESGKAYILKYDGEGAIYAENIETGNTHYLNKNQLVDIVHRDQLGKTFWIKAGKGREGRMGPWMMDEDLVDHLENTDSPVGFPALRSLRESVSQGHEEQYGSAMHSPYEGFKIVMIGPVFSNPRNIGEGQTTTIPQFATHLTAIEPGIQSGEDIAVERGIKWVVLGNEIRPNFGDKMNPWVRVQGMSERSQSFDTPQQAVQYVMGQYIDEEVPGNSAVLSATAESVIEADKALRMSTGRSASPVTPQEPQIPQIQQPVVEPVQPQQPIQDVQPQLQKKQPPLNPRASSSFRRMLRRINHK